MPIRFRCAYCNQLMGISKRKAGSVVKCPKCAGEIIVPSPDADVPDEMPGPVEPAPAPVPTTHEPMAPVPVAADGPGQAFEEKDFEEYFQEAASAGATAPAQSETPAVPSAPQPLPPPPPAPSPRRGLFLPVPMLILTMFVLILLLIIVFAIGVLIGRHSVHPPESNGTSEIPMVERQLL